MALKGIARIPSALKEICMEIQGTERHVGRGIGERIRTGNERKDKGTLRGGPGEMLVI